MTAAVLAALAAALLIGPDPAGGLARLTVRRAPSVGRLVGRGRVAVAVAGAVLVVVLLPQVGLLAVAAGIVGSTLWFLVRSHVARRRELRAASECARAARVLASLMAAGQIPTVALADAATDCPVLASAARACLLGADVADELDAQSRTPGQSALASVAAAWRLGERTGAPIATALSDVAEGMRREQRLAAVVESELAAARASGHIMAVLPFLAVGLGFAVGVNSPAFLFGDPLGRVLLVIGVALTAGGVVWIDLLSRGRRDR